MFAEVHIFTLSILHQFPQQQKRNFQRKIQLPKKEKVMGFSDWIEWKKKGKKYYLDSEFMDGLFCDWLISTHFSLCDEKKHGVSLFWVPRRSSGCNEFVLPTFNE